MYSKTQDDVELGYNSDLSLENHNGNPYESELPQKKHGKIIRNLRYIAGAIYRRVFAFIFMLNFGLLVWMMVTKATVGRLATACTANFTITILSRQESVVNMVYIIVVQGGKRAPLWLRLKLANVYKMFGGTHSGTSVSATFWLCFMIIRIVLDYYTVKSGENLVYGQIIVSPHSSRTCFAL